MGREMEVDPPRNDRGKPSPKLALIYSNREVTGHPHPRKRPSCCVRGVGAVV